MALNDQAGPRMVAAKLAKLWRQRRYLVIYWGGFIAIFVFMAVVGLVQSAYWLVAVCVFGIWFVLRAMLRAADATDEEVIGPLARWIRRRRK